MHVARACISPHTKWATVLVPKCTSNGLGQNSAHFTWPTWSELGVSKILPPWRAPRCIHCPGQLAGFGAFKNRPTANWPIEVRPKTVQPPANWPMRVCSKTNPSWPIWVCPISCLGGGPPAASPASLLDQTAPHPRRILRTGERPGRQNPPRPGRRPPKSPAPTGESPRRRDAGPVGPARPPPPSKRPALPGPLMGRY